MAYNEQETRCFLTDPVLRKKGYDDHQCAQLDGMPESLPGVTESRAIQPAATQPP